MSFPGFGLMRRIGKREIPLSREPPLRTGRRWGREGVGGVEGTGPPAWTVHLRSRQRAVKLGRGTCGYAWQRHRALPSDRSHSLGQPQGPQRPRRY